MMKYPEPYSKIWQASFELDQTRAKLCDLASQTNDLELLDGIGSADDFLKAASDELAKTAMLIFDRVHAAENPPPADWWKGNG